MLEALASLLGIEDGIVVPRVTVVSAPAAGSEIAIAVPGSVTWIPIGISFSLTTSAVVATRAVEMVFDDGSDEFCRCGSAFTQAASVTRRYRFAVLLGYSVNAPGTTTSLSGIPIFLLPGGYRIRSVTTGPLDVGDQFTSQTLFVVEAEHVGARKLHMLREKFVTATEMVGR